MKQTKQPNRSPRPPIVRDLFRNEEEARKHLEKYQEQERSNRLPTPVLFPVND